MPKQPTRKGKPKNLPKRYYSDAAEMADVLYRAAQLPQPERIQDVLARPRSATAAPASSVQRKHGGGRPRSFTSKQTGELQREQRRYEKAHPNEPKKDVEQHLQNWAKTKNITASLGTIRKHIMATTKNKN